MVQGRRWVTLIVLGSCLACGDDKSGPASSNPITDTGGVADGGPSDVAATDTGDPDAGRASDADVRTDGATEPDTGTGSGPVLSWRIEIAKDTTGVRVASVSKVELADDAVLRHGAVGPELLVVAYRGAIIKEARAVRFPRTLRFETDDALNEVDDVATTESRESLFFEIDPTVTRIDLVEVGGAVVTSIDRATLIAASGNGVRAFGLRSTGFPHVRILEPGDEDELPGQLTAYADEILAPTAVQMAALEDALGRVAPGAVGSVRTVAFVRYLRSNILGTTHGSSLILNHLLGPMQLRSTLVHEVAHCHTYLGDAAYVGSPFDSWPSDLREWVRPQPGLPSFLWQLPQTWLSFHAAGLAAQGTTAARPFKMRNSVGHPTTNAEAVAGGFASLYGSSRAHGWEDIADFTMTVMVPEVGGGPCERFSGDGVLDPTLSVTFAKLYYLLQVGLITQDALDTCVGVVAAPDLDGVQAEPLGAFELMPRARDVVVSGQSRLRVESFGVPSSTRQARIEVVTDGVDDPYEASRLDGFGTTTSSDGVDRFEIEIDGQSWRSSTGLFALLRDDGEVLEGAILLATMVDDAGGASTVVPYAPVRVVRPAPDTGRLYIATSLLNATQSMAIGRGVAVFEEAGTGVDLIDMLPVDEAMAASPVPRAADEDRTLYFQNSSFGTGVLSISIDRTTGLDLLGPWRTLSNYSPSVAVAHDGASGVLRLTSTTLRALYIDTRGRFAFGRDHRPGVAFDQLQFLPGAGPLVATTSAEATYLDYDSGAHSINRWHTVALESCGGSKAARLLAAPGGRHGYRLCRSNGTASVMRYDLTATTTLADGSTAPTLVLQTETSYGADLHDALAIASTAAVVVNDAIMFGTAVTRDWRFFVIPRDPTSGDVGPLQIIDVDLGANLRARNPAYTEDLVRRGLKGSFAAASPSGRIVLWGKVRAIPQVRIPTTVEVFTNHAGTWAHDGFIDLGAASHGYAGIAPAR